MTVLERRERIIEILKEKKRVDIKTLAKLLEVSEVTVRRDVRVLEKEGALMRSRGVLILPDVSKYELSFREREKENVELKRKIARKAAEFVEDGMVIGIDASTTALQLAKILVTSHANVTVVTPGLAIFRLLVSSPDLKVILVGGEYDEKNLSFVGALVSRNLEMFQFDLCFIGASALIPEKGCFTSDLDGAEVVRNLAKNSSKVIVIADSSKFRKSAQYLAVPVEEIDVVITDNLAEREFLKRFPPKVKVVVAR